MARTTEQRLDELAEYFASKSQEATAQARAIEDTWPPNTDQRAHAVHAITAHVWGRAAGIALAAAVHDVSPKEAEEIYQRTLDHENAQH